MRQRATGCQAVTHTDTHRNRGTYIQTGSAKRETDGKRWRENLRQADTYVERQIDKDRHTDAYSKKE